MEAALNNLDPKTWGKLREDGSASFIEDASEQLSPLVEFLSKLMHNGIIEKGDHICYTADESLNNLPLHYLPFREKRLIDFFSLSRIHNSLQLEFILKSKSKIPGNANAFIVPTQQNIKSIYRSLLEAKIASPVCQSSRRFWLKLDGLEISAEIPRLICSVRTDDQVKWDVFDEEGRYILSFFHRKDEYIFVIKDDQIYTICPEDEEGIPPCDKIRYELAVWVSEDRAINQTSDSCH